MYCSKIFGIGGIKIFGFANNTERGITYPRFKEKAAPGLIADVQPKA